MSCYLYNWHYSDSLHVVQEQHPQGTTHKELPRCLFHKRIPGLPPRLKELGDSSLQWNPETGTLKKLLSLRFSVTPWGRLSRDEI